MADASRQPNPVVELTVARFREFIREPGAVFWAFGFPVILALALGLAFRERGRTLPRVGLEPQAPAWLVQGLSAIDGEGSTEALIDLVADGEVETARALRIGAVDLVVRAAQGDSRALVYEYDPTREASAAARVIVDDALQRALGRSDLLPSSEVHLTAPGARYIDFLFPGIIGMSLMSSTLWGVGYSIVLARKRKQLKRLAATPMRRWHFILATFLSRVLFLVVEVALLLLFGWLVFDIVIRGSVPAFALVSLLGTASFGAIGLMIAARVSSVEAANGWLNLATFPMWMLSGVFFSYERFPEVTHFAIRLLPLTALNDGLRAIVNEGAGLVDVASQIVVLAVWAVVGFAIAASRFRWQ
ncbi:ABC transporter permease [Engelhardtia mirabilis]|uniref:ABC-2 family transporter protein n=1 Tax=Engelhardtia mirabilis TaxID=2528011 RepID=A0A518BLL8_9BACT|nr:ABC-2 family transporter protein [Planctomycetes bacterium Pla133]QDV02179.1 ABC-2 family transporter protein [Planctomycetes bacterium Pla86]